MARLAITAAVLAAAPPVSALVHYDGWRIIDGIQLLQDAFDPLAY